MPIPGADGARRGGRPLKRSIAVPSASIQGGQPPAASSSSGWDHSSNRFKCFNSSRNSSVQKWSSFLDDTRQYEGKIGLWKFKRNAGTLAHDANAGWNDDTRAPTAASGPTRELLSIPGVPRNGTE